MKQSQPSKQNVLFFTLLLSSSLCFSQVSQEWVKRYNGPGNGNDYVRSLAVDANGNVYVTGNSGTIKYDAAGKELWLRKGGNGLAVDNSGNVYVAGTSIDSIESEWGMYYFQSYATFKYDTNGNELWAKRYNGTVLYSDNVPYAIAVDASGNVYVTGEGDSQPGVTFGYYTTIKYDATGKELWVKQQGGDSRATSLAVDAAGNVYVTGDNCLNCDIGYLASTTIKYDAAGNKLWEKGYFAIEGGGGSAVTYLVAVDGAENVYVTGGDRTIKYDAAGNELWVKSSSGNDIVLGSSGNVYVAGYRRTDPDNPHSYVAATIKYDTNGTELWVKSSSGNGIAVDGSGNVYVTGLGGTYPNYDYATIKYDANGNEQWAERYNGTKNSRDEAKAIVIDAAGNVYVTGQSYGDGTGYDYATLKYAQTQVTTWYRDADGDGFGNPNSTKVADKQPKGYVSNNLDCNDKNKVKGGPEVCDGIDNDCDGVIDDGLTERTFYSDFDGDGYGSNKRTITTCAAPPRFIAVAGDCNDDNANVYPGAPELCDGRDNDCDSKIDDGLTRTPFYWDADKDGYGFRRPVYACAAPPGYIAVGGDFNDNDTSIHPGAVEHCDGVDEDCDGVIDNGFPQKRFYKDRDGDGRGSYSNLMAGCAPKGYVQKTGDCDDYNASVHPEAAEVPKNGVDDNCDGEVDETVTTVTWNKAVGEKKATPLQLQLTATPNPSPHGFNLHIQSSSDALVQLRVVDGIGRVVEIRQGLSANTNVSVGCQYRPGVYYVQLSQGDKKKYLKLVKASQ